MEPEIINSDLQAASVPGVQRAESLSKKLAGHAKTVLTTLVVALFLKTFVVEAYRIPTASMENTLLVGDFLLVNKLAYGFRTPRYIPVTSVVVPSFSLPFFAKVESGDIVVFEYPGDRDQLEASEPVYFVKRCIGLPGDKVEIRKGRVSVNGRMMLLPDRGISGNGSADSYGHRMYPPGARYTDYNYGPVVVPGKGDRITLNSGNIEQWRRLILREGHRIESGKDDSVLIDGQARSEYVVERDYYFVMGDNRGNSMDSRYWGFVPDENLVGEALLVYWSWDTDVPVNSLGENLKRIRWERVGRTIR